MALSDVLKPVNEKHVLERLEAMDTDQIKVALKESMKMGYFWIALLILEHTEIKHDKELLNSLSDDIDEMRKIIKIVDEYGEA